MMLGAAREGVADTAALNTKFEFVDPRTQLSERANMV
jgi:hypothetical protein